MKKNIAIIGGGIAGLTASYYLNKKHHVTLFERSHRIGGNAYTLKTHDHESLDIAVAAFGLEGYKTFYALLDELGIGTDLCANTYMTMHNMETNEGLYLTPSLKGGLTQGLKMLRPQNFKNLLNLFTGLSKANKMLDNGELEGLTLEQCLDLIPQMQGDTRRVFLCTLCLMSSMDADEVLSTPAAFFIRKLKVHNDVISPKALYSVRCVQGGTEAYIKALASHFEDRIEYNSQIKTVKRNQANVEIVMEDDSNRNFDAVVFACNADQALALIEDPTAEEKNLLGVWKYKHGKVVVHRDHTHFPARDLIQAYTFLYTEKNNRLNTSVNGALWYEPQASNDCDYISSQHPNFEIRKELIEFENVFKTPIFDFNSIKAIEKMPSLNGVNNSYFCGSHFGFGLHDDAISSAIKVASYFGVAGPRPKEDFFEPSVKGLLNMAKKFRPF